MGDQSIYMEGADSYLTLFEDHIFSGTEYLCSGIRKQLDHAPDQHFRPYSTSMSVCLPLRWLLWEAILLSYYINMPSSVWLIFFRACYTTFIIGAETSC